MSAAVQGSRDKLRTPKPKPTQDGPATPSVATQNPTAAPVPVVHESPADHVKDDSAKDTNGSRYDRGSLTFWVSSSASGGVMRNLVFSTVIHHN